MAASLSDVESKLPVGALAAVDGRPALGTVLLQR